GTRRRARGADAVLRPGLGPRRPRGEGRQPRGTHRGRARRPAQRSRAAPPPDDGRPPDRDARRREGPGGGTPPAAPVADAVRRQRREVQGADRVRVVGVGRRQRTGPATAWSFVVWASKRSSSTPSDARTRPSVPAAGPDQRTPDVP